MATSFDLAIPIILFHETGRAGGGDGAYTNKPNDLGGPTKYGVTGATLGAWRKLGRPATEDEVRALQLLEAEAIYRANYWERFRCGEFDDQVVATKVMDISVNCLPSSTGLVLQRAINQCQPGAVVEDGVIGSKTVAAANGCDSAELLLELVHALAEHYRAIVREDASQQGNLAGWLDRSRWPFENQRA